MTPEIGDSNVSGAKERHAWFVAGKIRLL